MKPIPLAMLASFVTVSSMAGAVPASAETDDQGSTSRSLNAFVGAGDCTGTVMATDKHAAYAVTAKYRGEKVFDGSWVAMHYDANPTAADPKPFHVVQYIGYDAAKKRFVGIEVDNASNGGTGTSEGWKGDQFTLDQSAAGESAVSFRDVFSTGAAGMSSHTGMMRGKDGKWTKTDEETCKRS